MHGNEQVLGAHLACLQDASHLQSIKVLTKQNNFNLAADLACDQSELGSTLHSISTQRIYTSLEGPLGHDLQTMDLSDEYAPCQLP